MIDELPEQWRLSAPESQVLLSGPDTPSSWAIKLALKELVLRKALTLHQTEERRFRVFKKRVNVLSPGTSLDSSAGRPLRAIMEIYPKAHAYGGGITGVSVEKLAQEIMGWYRAGGGFVKGEVLPELERKGLYERKTEGTNPTWALTSNGEEALAELRGLLETGRQSLPNWAANDRSQARTFVEAAGPALLLLGNPAPWLWLLLTAELSGEEVAASAMGDPFAEPLPAELEQSQQADGGGGFTVVWSTSGGSDPGDTVDQGVDAATDDGDGGGDGE
jgi:hypothetical protein